MMEEYRGNNSSLKSALCAGFLLYLDGNSQFQDRDMNHLTPVDFVYAPSSYDIQLL